MSQPRETNRRKNILYLHRTQGQGVEGVHIWGIASGFKRLGHFVQVVSPSGIHESTPPEPATAQQPGGRGRLLQWLSKNLPELLFELAEIAYNLFMWRQIKAAATRAKPDLLYERYAIFATAGMRYSRKHGVPLMLEVNYTSRSELVRDRSELLKPLAHRQDRELFHHASAITVVSSYLKDHLVEEFDIPPEKVLVCPNAADPEIFSVDVPGVDSVGGVELAGRDVIGFVGTFSPWHGVELLVDAFCDISDDFPEAVVLLVGDGPTREPIREKVEQRGLGRRILFAGSVPHDKLPAYVGAFSVGVMPDSNNYGSPMKIFEYMAMGKPVVVPDYGPLLDVVEHGKQGMVFNRQDRESLAAALGELLTDRDRRQAMGRAAREHIETTHNWLENSRQCLEFVNARVDSSAD